MEQTTLEHLDNESEEENFILVDFIPNQYFENPKNINYNLRNKYIRVIQDIQHNIQNYLDTYYIKYSEDLFSSCLVINLFEHKYLIIIAFDALYLITHDKEILYKEEIKLDMNNEEEFVRLLPHKDFTYLVQKIIEKPFSRTRFNPEIKIQSLKDSLAWRVGYKHNHQEGFYFHEKNTWQKGEWIRNHFCKRTGNKYQPLIDSKGNTENLPDYLEVNPVYIPKTKYREMPDFHTLLGD